MEAFVRQAKAAGEPVSALGSAVVAPRVVLVPLLNTGLAGDMLDLAAHLTRSSAQGIGAVAGERREPGPPRIVVLSVVEVPPDQPLTMGLDMARSYRALLDFLPAQVEVQARAGGARYVTGQVRVDRMVKVARDVAAAIRQAAHDEKADLVLLYWKGYAREPKQHQYGRIVDALLVNPPCSVMPARVEGWHRGRRLLLPVRGGPAAEEALALGVGLAERAGLPLTVLHNVPRTPTVPNLERLLSASEEGGEAVSQVEALGEEPFLVFNEELNRVREAVDVPIESILTRVEDPAQAILSEVRADDIVIMGLGPQGQQARVGGESLALQVSAAKGPPLLLLSVPAAMDLRAYNRRLQARVSGRSSRGRAGSRQWADMPFEHWFVEHTFHGDEFKDPEEFLRAKRAGGLSMSVVVLTSNDGERIHSVIMGLRKVLQEMHPLADQILVVDAGSSDGTPERARDLGAEVYEASEILAEQGDLHGRGESWWKSLAVAKGDLVVWLDPRARRFHPSTALALAGPLLRLPTLQMVKAFGGTRAEGKKEKRESRRERDDFSPVDMSWGGFVVPTRGENVAHPQVRVQALQPQDLESLDAGQMASLPPRTLFQVLCPALAGVIAPFGRDMAARRDAMVGLPVFTGESLDVGLLLSVATEFGTNAIAQVELGQGQPAPPPQPGLRGAGDLLQVMARRLQDAGMRRHAERIATRLAQEIEGKRNPALADGAVAARMFEVRALGPVERPPMQLVLRDGN
jgi:glucosyl-3-phosphoglycerate synthase